MSVQVPDQEEIAKLIERVERLEQIVTVDVWLDTADAAAYVGCHRNTLLVAYRKGEITAEKNVTSRNNGKVYFQRSQLDAWRKNKRRRV